jgi:mRNA interferase MazF
MKRCIVIIIINVGLNNKRKEETLMSDKGEKVIKRGEIYYAKLGASIGSEQGGTRPVLIVQNDVGNKYSPTTIVVALTTSRNKKKLPTHVLIRNNKRNGLNSDSTALCEQIRTIDKSKIEGKIGLVDNETLDNVLSAVKVSLAMI